MRIDHEYYVSVFSSDSGEVVSKAVMHPPHLLGPNNEPMPSALIPFCQYQSESLGKTIPGSRFLACDSFEPSVINGRLCYSLKDQLKRPTKYGRKNGLMLMIDPGQIIKRHNDDDKDGSFKIYIHTLSGFSGYKAGSYALDSLKQMTVTSGFMSLLDDQKRCQNEVWEDCQRLKLFDEFQKQCDCIPWPISRNYDKKVAFNCFLYVHNLF